MIEYKIVSEYDRNYVTSKVNDLIKEGYKPVGGINVTFKDSRKIFTQALVKDA